MFFENKMADELISLLKEVIGKKDELIEMQKDRISLLLRAISLISKSSFDLETQKICNEFLNSQNNKEES